VVAALLLVWLSQLDGAARPPGSGGNGTTTTPKATQNATQQATSPP
jgi:hypothetical protein